MNEIVNLLLNEIVAPSSCAIVGSILTAVFLKKNTSSEEFMKIKAGKYKEAIDMLVENGKMSYSELYKIDNFSKIAEKADCYIKNKSQNKCLAYDWIMRFYEAVGNIGDEELHNVWAKLLAGEFENPGSYSYKTIDALKNMTKNDALIFKTICDSSIEMNDQIFLPNYDEYLSSRNIRYVDVMLLNENGLIFNDGSITLNQNATQERSILIDAKRYAIIKTSKIESSKVFVKEFPFTKVGKELYRLLDISSNLDNIVALAKEIQKDNSNISVEVYEIMGRQQNSIRLGETDLLNQINKK